MLLMFRLFLRKEMELSLIGLQEAGKTSLVNVLSAGDYQEDMIPTVLLANAGLRFSHALRHR